MRTDTAAPAADTSAAEEVVHSARLTQIEATITQAGHLTSLLHEISSAEDQMQGCRAALAQFDAFYAKASLLPRNSYEIALKELAHKEGQIASLKHERNSSSDAAVRTLCGMGWSHEGGEQWKPPFGKSPLFAKLIPTVDDIAQGIQRRIDAIEAKGEGPKALTELSDAINDVLASAGADPVTEHRAPEAVRTVGDAVRALKRALKADEGFAWVWHANIATTVADSSSLGHRLANKTAAALMQHLFDVDMEGCEHYRQSQVEPPSEPGASPVVVGIDLSAEAMALIKEASDAARDLTGLPVDVTAEEDEAFKAIKQRPDLLDTSDRETLTYDWEQFVSFGRRQALETNRALNDGMAWSFSFYGHAVTHENNSRYLMAGNRVGDDMLIFNQGDTITVDLKTKDVSIKSPPTPDSLETLGNPTGNRRVFRAFIPGDIVRVTDGDHRFLIGEYLNTRNERDRGMVRLFGGNVIYTDVIEHKNLELAPMEVAAKLAGKVNTVNGATSVGGSRNLQFEGKFGDETLRDRFERLIKQGWAKGRIKETEGYLNVNGDVVYPKGGVAFAPVTDSAEKLPAYHSEDITMTLPMSLPAQPVIIEPNIGRRVWFWPAKNSGATGFICHDEAVPMDAGIVFVHSDRCVNLDVCDHAGNHHAFTSVYLDQGDDCPRDPDAARCEWMPYQKGQARKGAN